MKYYMITTHYIDDIVKPATYGAPVAEDVLKEFEEILINELGFLGDFFFDRWEEEEVDLDNLPDAVAHNHNGVVSRDNPDYEEVFK